ncbi:MAG: RNA-binding transcriptional accessory protein, partial [Methylococcaceae bacterium]|nr:RNA-binding transcriptional accessory protein [Methylococcaceae bacterium]
MDITLLLSKELAVRNAQVEAAIQLLDEGASVPFISRYRKEVTGGLDDTQLRNLEERLNYLRELEARRKTILDSIESQDKLTPELKQAINEAETKNLLEDLYLPYKPKRRTKAQQAREAGLEPLLDELLNNRRLTPLQIAETYLNPEHKINDAKAALEGAKQILMERISEDAVLLAEFRERVWERGILQSQVIKNKETQAVKFKDYFDYSEAINKIPSHRALALFRGRNEDLLTLTLLPAFDEKQSHDYYIQRVRGYLKANDANQAVNTWLQEVARFAWKVKLFTRIDLDLKLRLHESAEVEGIRVFADNLRDLLLAAPAGAKVTMGLDPGIRTGVKVAIVDVTGKVVDTATIYPHPPKKQWDESISTLAKLIAKHHIQLISIGNGTGSRETDQLVADLAKR